jgi:hypothetical protein
MGAGWGAAKNTHTCDNQYWLVSLQAALRLRAARKPKPSEPYHRPLAVHVRTDRACCWKLADHC